MSVMELLTTRRTYRRFAQKAVPQDVVDDIVQAVRLSSCGANRQAVRLVLVQSPEMVAKVQPLVKWAGYLPPEQGTPKADELPTFYAAVVQDTAIPGDLATDTGIALANMTLAAWDKGVGSSKEDVPVIPEVTTRPVMVIFMADKGNGETVVVGETAKIDVLKTEDSVKVADIDKKLLPEGYHLENEKAVVEIRKDASKGEYIIVFVTDVTYTPATKEVDIKVAITNPKAGEAVMTTVKANVKKDATTISAAEITLPDGFTWAEGTEMDRQYDIATYVFPIKHIA